MEKYTVYVHTCPNGKKYVGCTTLDPETRWGVGKYYKWAKEFDWNEIKHEVIECSSREEMYEKERELIALYRSNYPEYGYNISSGGMKGSTLPYWRKRQLRKPLYRVILPGGKVGTMTKGQAVSYYRNYYLKYPTAKRVDIKYLEQVSI